MSPRVRQWVTMSDETPDTPQVDGGETTEVPEDWESLTDEQKMEAAEQILANAAANSDIEGTAEPADEAPRTFTDPDSVE